MSRQHVFLFGLVMGFGASAIPAGAQVLRNGSSSSTADAVRPEVTLIQALQSHPVTAPYRFTAAWRDGKLALSGRVGSKQVHDVAVRIAIALNLPIRDDLVIDTAEAHRAAAAATATTPVATPRGTPSLGAMPYTMGALPYVYPPPLFGMLDDPFFGFEPPLLSYPPWWRGVAARDGGASTSVAAQPVAVANPAGNAGVPVDSNIAAQPAPGPGEGTVEMTLDQRGVATLRGTVGTLADRIAVGQRIAQSPGIVEVINLINVSDNAQGAPNGLAPPPPPPQPALVPAVKPVGEARPAGQPIAADARPALAVDAGNLTRRIADAFSRRPALADLPLKVTVRDGIATLSGRAPTVFEAMQTFRLVQQTPGVAQIIDRLEFTVPDGEKRNPLIAKGRPEDVEPYLAAQLARQVGDLAHIDQVRMRGDILEIKGTLAQADDRARLDAILRSTPILRGFRLEPDFVVD